MTIRTLTLLLLGLGVVMACTDAPAPQRMPEDAGAVDTDTAEPQPDVEADGWWSADPDYCGLDEVRVGMERYAPPAPPAELGVVPRILWETREVCEGRLSEKIRGESTYGPLTIDGVTEPRLAAVEYDYVGPVIEAVPSRIGTLDPHTGQSQHCLNLFGDRTNMGVALMLEPEHGLYYTTYSLGDASASTLYLNAGPQPPPFFKSYPLKTDPPVHGPRLALTPQGLIVQAVGVHFLVGYDALSGLRLWAKNPLTDWNLPDVDPERRAVGVFVDHAAPDEVLVGVLTHHVVDEPPVASIFQLDKCGNRSQELFRGPPAYYIVRLSNGDHVAQFTQDSNRTMHQLGLWKNWQLTYKAGKCDSFVVLSDERVACLLTRSSSQPTPQIQIHDFEGEPVTVGLGPVTDVRRWLAAGAGDVLILVGTYVDEQGRGRGGLLFIRPPYDTPELLELPPVPMPGGSGGLESPPLIAPDGVLYFAGGGYLRAIQTDIFGLARSVYPRSGLGGNANRGHVVLDP